ncbi:hypothetical protein GCM10027160_33030 [Streptomyces calidiresistens]
MGAEVGMGVSTGPPTRPGTGAPLSPGSSSLSARPVITGFLPFPLPSRSVGAVHETP